MWCLDCDIQVTLGALTLLASGELLEPFWLVELLTMLGCGIYGSKKLGGLRGRATEVAEVAEVDDDDGLLLSL
jgi:hypothetical protein